MSMSSGSAKWLARAVERHNRGEDILQIRYSELKVRQHPTKNTFEDVVYDTGIMFLSKETRAKINSVLREIPDADYYNVEIAGRNYIVQVSLNTTTVGEIAEFDGYVLII